MMTAGSTSSGGYARTLGKNTRGNHNATPQKKGRPEGAASYPDAYLSYCVTVKTPELVATPPAVVIAIFPVFAPVGTVAVTCVSEFTVKFVATTPPNVTLVVCVRLTPVIWTAVPTAPLVGLKLKSLGRYTKRLVAGQNGQASVSLVTDPVSAPGGTVTDRKVEPVFLTAVAFTPSNFTTEELLNPCPRMPTVLPTMPE